MVVFSCKNCTERYVGCHSTCPKYLQEKAEHDRVKEEDHKKNETIWLNTNGVDRAGRKRKRRAH